MSKAIISFFRNNLLFNKFPILKQLTKFALVGVSSFVIDIIVYFVLTRTSSFFSHNYLLANCLSFIVAVIWSFAINRYWTFRVMGLNRIGLQYFKFFTTATIGLILNTILLYLAVAKLDFYDIVAKFLVAIVVMFWNFFTNKYWTFKITDNQNVN